MKRIIRATLFIVNILFFIFQRKLKQVDEPEDAYEEPHQTTNRFQNHPDKLEHEKRGDASVRVLVPQFNTLENNTEQVDDPENREKVDSNSGAHFISPQSF
jgi:hypothetical protein